MRNFLGERVLDYLLEGFQLISFDWTYLYVNKSVVEQSKFSKTELVGFTMMEKYPGIENSELFKTLKDCMDNRVARQTENEFIYADGSKAWFRLNIQPVPEGIFILSLDITNIKKMQEKLYETNRYLEARVIKRTTELAARNKDLTDSINYAKKIQRSKLATKEEVNQAFPDCFILFKPKAIVSGDFYFFHQTKQYAYIAAADCTGHGVPGALLSMLCSEKLSEAILKYKEPCDILAYVNIGIKYSLRQSLNGDSSKDGMDIALCAIDLNTREVKFSGANRPLWVIKKNTDEVLETKGTRDSIGGYTSSHQQFQAHNFQLEKGDLIYLFTDGYVDQFNGFTGKKLLAKRFKSILLEIKNKPMPQQKKYLMEFMNTWRNESEQIDDLLVIGLKL